MGEFKPGDVVQRKSGGQIMTVSSCGSDTITCIWSGESGKPLFAHLSPNVLKLVPDFELKRIARREENRLDAKAGSTLSDKAAKWAPVVAAVASGAIAWATFEMKAEVKSLVEEFKKPYKSAVKPPIPFEKSSN